jgi:ribulose-5-phosphate 4-epimerase/fuculose-1-phosphate aldolase
VTAKLSEVTRLRDLIVAVGKSLFDRGLTPGSTGNISVRLSDGSFLMTPTNASLGDLDPGRLSHLDPDGTPRSGDAPTKEAFLHRCMYCERAGDGAVVHLHSTHAVGVSILEGVDPADVLPPMTAYYLMRVGRLALARAVQALAGRHHAVLLANHGPVVSGRDLRTAQFAIEELEETARLFLLVGHRAMRLIDPAEAARLRPRAESAQ